jgi:hypothetical protein
MILTYLALQTDLSSQSTIREPMLTHLNMLTLELLAIKEEFFCKGSGHQVLKGRVEHNECKTELPLISLHYTEII